MAAPACQLKPSESRDAGWAAARLSDGLGNTDGASQCNGKSTNMPSRLVLITKVSTCTCPNSSSEAASPVSKPAASGSASQNTRPLRNTHSSSENVSSSPATLIKRLSRSASALAAAAKSAPPALKVCTPCCSASERLCASSGNKSLLPLATPLCSGKRARNHTQVLPLSSSVNNMPLSACHCSLLKGCACASVKRPKPNQSWSSGKGEGAAKGLSASSARCRK